VGVDFDDWHEAGRKFIGGFEELMPNYREMEALLDGMTAVALPPGKGQLYEISQRIPEKAAPYKQKS
jgi:hypothetical protein